MSSPHHFLELLCVVVLIFWWLGLKVYKQSVLSESRTLQNNHQTVKCHSSKQQELLRYLEELRKLPAHNWLICTIRLFGATLDTVEQEELAWFLPQPVTKYLYLRSL